MVDKLTHLKQLEAESIHIIREVAAEFDNPVMLYSIGKDSSAVMLHLARKAFFPGKLPFPLLHVDTRWKFREMYGFRERMVERMGLDLITHINPEGVAKGINPFTHGSAKHTDIMKTEGLKQALDKYGFDAAFGGARRDEEKSRAKERIYSFRDRFHRWDPKNQRPELWNIYNGKVKKGESRSASSRSPTGPSWTSGSTSTWRHPDRSAVLRRRARGHREERHADHDRRRAHPRAPHARAEGQHPEADGAFPHPRLLPADRRGGVQPPPRCRKSSRKCC